MQRRESSVKCESQKESQLKHMDLDRGMGMGPRAIGDQGGGAWEARVVFLYR